MKSSYTLAAAVVVFGTVLALVASPGSGTPRQPGAWEWKPTVAFGGPPTRFSAAFTIGEKAYVGSGYGAKNALWQYDPGRDAWRRKADLPGKERGAAVAFAVGNKGYIGLGYGDNDRFSDLWQYDPSDDHWTPKASLPAEVRDHSGVFVIGSKAYILGGMTCKGEDCRDLKEVWEYDPRSDHWTRKSDLPETITGPTGFVLNAKAYVGTGYVNEALSKFFWEYDPRSDRWTRKADFPGPARFRAVGWAMNGRGYLGTGLGAQTQTSAEVFDDIWEYDPSADVWSPVPAFGGPARGAAVVFVLGSRIYIGTGMNAVRADVGDFWRSGPAVEK